MPTTDSKEVCAPDRITYNITPFVRVEVRKDGKAFFHVETSTEGLGGPVASVALRPGDGHSVVAAVLDLMAEFHRNHPLYPLIAEAVQKHRVANAQLSLF